MNNRHFYPAIEPYHHGQLEVDAPHVLYWEECGNPNGEPILFVHCGPGAGCSKGDRCFFDPAHVRIVLLDQRGCGRSRPVGELEANTTAHLVADFEHLRRRSGFLRAENPFLDALLDRDEGAGPRSVPFASAPAIRRYPRTQTEYFPLAPTDVSS